MADLFNFTETPNGGFTEKREPRVERALVFVEDRGELFNAARFRAFFIAGYGPGIEEALDNGLDRNGELGPTPFAPDEPGLWLWDGTPYWHAEYSEGIYEGSVPEYEKRGTWRRLTSEEALQLASGHSTLLTPPNEEE